MQQFTKEIQNLRKIIGKNIYNQRCAQKITLKKLSRLTRLNINLIDQYELGKNNIGLLELTVICKVLGISPEKVLIDIS